MEATKQEVRPKTINSLFGITNFERRKCKKKELIVKKIYSFVWT